MKIIKQCLYCKSDFEADTKEINRGNAKYCSLKCSGANSYKNINPVQHQCKHCGNQFYSKSKTTKYCSTSCKQKNYTFKSKGDFSMKTFARKMQSLPCQICGWEEATRDLHHIIPVSKGGKNVENNIIAVCPNHHRMIHSKLISEADLFHYKSLNL